MENLKTKKYIKWALLLVVVVLIYGYTQMGWFGGTTESDTDWLVVLHAGEAEIITTDGEVFVILSEISNNTILFSDRPDREYQSIDTDVFLGQWDALFESSPPNAAMVHSEVGVDTEVVVIEMFSPIATASGISFPIKIVGGEYTEGEIYKDVNLFIDGAKLFKWNSCTGGFDGRGFSNAAPRVCVEQWGSYPASCGYLDGRTNSRGKKCKQSSACKNARYDSDKSWDMDASTYNCDE